MIKPLVTPKYVIIVKRSKFQSIKALKPFCRILANTADPDQTTKKALRLLTD